MASLANYIVIRSEPFALQAEQQRIFTFEAPADLVTDLSLARPLLVFQIETLASAAGTGTALAIAVNDHPIRRWESARETQCGVWESFPGHFLWAGNTNTLQFRL